MTKAASPASTGHDHQHAHDHNHSSPIAENNRLQLKFSWSELEPEYHKALQRLAGKLKLAGFRAGKVPAHLAEKNVKPLELYSATLTKIFAPKYQQALEQTKALPICEPELSIEQAEKGKDWVVIAEFATRPEINVQGYEKVAKAAKKTALEPATAAKSKSDKSDDTKPEDKQLSAIYKALLEHFKPRIQAILLKQETQRDLERLSRDLQRVNLTLDAYLAQRQMSFDDLSSALAYEALGRLQLIFLLDAIAQKARLTVTDEEAKSALPKPKSDQPVTQPTPELIALLKQAKLRDKVALHLLSIG